MSNRASNPATRAARASALAKSTTSDASCAQPPPAARDGGPDFTRHPLYSNITAQGRGCVAPCDPKL